MSEKEELIVMQGVVTKLLPNAMFLVTLDNKHEIVAHSSGKIRKNRIRIVAGDRVTIEMSMYDLTKGRITLRNSGKMGALEATDADAKKA